ncbi:MAG: hypothetical protein ACLP07_15785 [Terracidiphilus sp.]
MERYCVSSGARSISDLARSAICALLSHANEENSLIVTVHEHSALVKGLEGKIELLTTEIELLKAGRRSSAISLSKGGQEIPHEIESDN